MTRTLALLTLLAALPASAQDPGKKWDVGTPRDSVVGDAVRRTRKSAMVVKRRILEGTKLVSEDEVKRGYDVVQTDEVLGAEKGEFVHGRRVYERYFDLQAGKEVPLAGLTVEHVRAADRTFSWKKSAGPDVPGFLNHELELECKRLSRAAQDRAEGKGDGRDPLLPLEPVAVGERWTIPLERACQGFGLVPEDVDADTVQVSGVLEQVEPDGEWRRVKITGSLGMKSMGGRAFSPPARWSAEIQMRLRPGDIEGTYRARGTIRGSFVDGPTGRTVSIEQTWETVNDRVVIDPEMGR